MEELCIEPKMIDFGNSEVNKAQKSLNKLSDDNYKKDDELSRRESEN